MVWNKKIKQEAQKNRFKGGLVLSSNNFFKFEFF